MPIHNLMSQFVFALMLALSVSSCSKKAAMVDVGADDATVKAKRGIIEQEVTWRGSVRSSQRIEIRAERKVKISKSQVNNFQPVKKGQLLLEVDNSETETKIRELKDKTKTMELEFQSVTIKHRHAQKVLERKKSLFDKGIIAQKEFDDAAKDARLVGSEIRAKELEVEKLGRDLAEAHDQLKSSNFVAPMEGVVTGLVLPDSTGTDVQAGQSVATVSDPNRLALWVGVEETHLHKIKRDMKAVVTLDSVPNKEFEGKVISVGTTEMQGQGGRQRVYEVGISFPADKQPIREGYTGRAKVAFDRKKDALTVPLAALKYMDGKDYVAVAAGVGGGATAKLVSVGIRTDNEAEILSGVSENDTLFLPGQK